MIGHANHSQALILAAHGSTHEPSVNIRIQTLVEHIGSRSDFYEVIAAFHQGEPRFCEALNHVESDQICVVPLMTSEGYYATQQLSAALALNPRFEKVNLWQTRPVGTHPALGVTIAHRVKQLASKYDIDMTSLSIVLVGHGTSRHTASRQATQSIVEAVKQRLSIAQVFSAFIDDQPPIESILHRAVHQSVIVIPFLMGGGTHAVHDLPRRLGLSLEPERNNPINGYVDGKLLIVDYPVGHYPEIADWVISLATSVVEAAR